MWFVVFGTVLSIAGWSLFLCYADGRWEMNAEPEELVKCVAVAGVFSAIAGTVCWAFSLPVVLILVASALVPAAIVGFIALLVQGGKYLNKMGREARLNRAENDE